MELVYSKEKMLFGVSLTLSLLFWTGMIVGTVGVVLLWVLMFFLFYLFAQSAFISYLKGTAVLITAKQFPDLHQRVSACAAKLGMKEVPDAYLMHGNGIFNALATRFLGRNFIVLFSDVVDALDERPEAVNFYIGHELGHIKRSHLLWAPVLFPAGILPLLGAAYSRAREYTCDRHGLVCCASAQDASYGMAALAAGGKRWKTMSQSDYIAQSKSSPGFWMSLHELIGDYPWLVKRMAAIEALGAKQKLNHPRRNFFAYLFALLIPRVGVGAGGGVASVFILVAIIGILAAIAVPAYQDYTVRARVIGATAVADNVKSTVADYALKNLKWPASNRDIGLPETGFGSGVSSIQIEEKGVVVVKLSEAVRAGAILVYAPYVENGTIKWNCSSEGLAPNQVPSSCR